ncbi:MAG: radical SAM protein [Thermodesulfobacteriota bacterium]
MGKNTREQEKISFLKFIRILKRGVYNLIENKSMVVSFELTNSCNANCRHCDSGGIKREEHLLKPEEYGIITKKLNPVAVQISGGEPLLRRDVIEIVREIRKLGSLPLIVLVTNGALLDEEKYVKLKEAGVNYFAVSLDFPDKRHDEWRSMPGLFSRLRKRIPQLASLGRRDIVLNAAITRENLPYLLDLAEIAEHWGVSISYSAYSSLRTGDKSLSISSEDDLRILRQKIKDLIKIKRGKDLIPTPAWSLEKIYRFFEDGFIPHCLAGIRSLVVTPEGYIIPCSMQRAKFSSREELIKDFPPRNNCGECYVSIRSWGERTVYNILEEGIFLVGDYLKRGLAKIAK